MRPKQEALKWPLRRVLSRDRNDAGNPTEALECGHTIHQPQDAFGYTYANRRRCYQCWKAEPASNAEANRRICRPEESHE